MRIEEAIFVVVLSLSGLTRAEAEEFEVLQKGDIAAINKAILALQPVTSVKMKPAARAFSAELEDDGPTRGLCKLNAYNMMLINEPEDGNREERTYHVLSDGEHPGILMLRSKRLAIDADGSPRSYHPLDAYGTCAPGPDGPCALDNLNGSAGVWLCAKPAGASEPTCYKGEEFANRFAKIWPEISGKPPAAKNGKRYEYKTADGKVFVSFKSTIIPQSTKDAAPCLNRLGYFLSLTSLSKQVPKEESNEPEGCSYLTPNAEEVPFMVIPQSAFAAANNGTISVGDIALVHYENGAASWQAYAVVGDEGPPLAFGEGSIGLAQALRSAALPVKQRSDIETLDINTGFVTFLLLGGSRARLGGNYSVANIKLVGGQVFKDWLAGDKKSRFHSCRIQARPN